MKKTILPIMALCIAFAAPAEDYNYLTIKQADKVVSIPLADIQNVKFTVSDESTPVEVEPEYVLRVLTFEDEDYLGDGNFLGQKNWSSLIDTPQYGGPLLYGSGDDAFELTTYWWYDQNNTELASVLNDGTMDYYVYWSGGNAISDYTANNYATEEVGYTEQLAIPGTEGQAGYDHSKNFCVHNGASAGQNNGGIFFKDDKARVVDHMYVILTSYGLSTGKLGDSYTPAATDDDWVLLTAQGIDANGEKHETSIYLLKDGQYVDQWTKWDLSELGEVVRVNFGMTSNMANDWGMTFPAYFAFDNVAVRFPAQQ